MPFKSERVKEKFLAGARAYRDKVQEDACLNFCSNWTRNQAQYVCPTTGEHKELNLAQMRRAKVAVGCIMAEGAMAVGITYKQLANTSDQARLVRMATGLRQDEVRLVVAANDGGGPVWAKSPSSQADARRAVNHAYNLLTEIPVRG